MPSQRPTIQKMCDELKQMGDILACYAVSKEGRLLGASYGVWLPLDEKLKADFSELASVVWGGVDRVTNIGGLLKSVVITFENFKLVGFPIEGTNMALLLTVEVKLDPEVLKARVHDFVSYWLTVNDYVK